jgi:hypothetical protein
MSTNKMYVVANVESAQAQLNERIQADDIRILDYNLVPLEGTKLKVRGSIDSSKPFGVVIGSAHTFGRYVATPFSEIVAHRNNIQILNLGFLGAGPGFFLERPALLRWINRAEFVVVQAMSGRSVANFAFETCENQDEVRKRGSEDKTTVERAYRALLLSGEPAMAIALRSANRIQWLRETTELFRRITVPRKCLLWFSKRKLNYIEGLETLERYWADMPHFLTRPLIEEFTRTSGIECLEVVSREGLPQIIRDMKLNKPIQIWPVKDFPSVKLRCHNHYYPSPQMHERCAGAVSDWVKSNRAPAKVPQASAARRRIIIHYHIFKNAGSSIDTALADVLGKRWRSFDPQIYLSDDDDRIDGTRCKENANSDELDKFLKINTDVYAVSTHQSRIKFALSPSLERLELSLIRNPVGRALSIWKYERRPDRQATFDSQMGKQAALLSFEEFIKWCLLTRRPPLAPFSNFQVRALSGNPMWEGRVSYSDLDRAIEYATRVGCVGIVERFERTLELLNQRIQAFIPGIELRSYHVNKSGTTQESGDEEARQLLTKGTYELLLEANAFDLAMYNHVLRVGGY